MENLIYKTLTLNQNNKSCTIDNKEINLTKNEYNLLVLFLSNPDIIYSREELIDKVWTKKVGIGAVNTCISRLKHKLDRYSTNIITRNGFGYMFKTK